ncbi:fimbrillin family protein [uncultured Bacteroides sp.]|jgi:hypothetical protein|uniref:fimbrillin family protein n=1 Tax=uncultured Bacteroides sp. TaxID=162156 RepID=UPI0025DE7C24|nr:fimbrillin family protein [uncultured Bacteroides sp.]
MKRMTLYSIYAACLGLALCLAGCGQEEMTEAGEQPADVMRFSLTHPDEGARTRVTETHFEKDDRIGLYVCTAEAPLEVGGNYVNNALLTFNGSAWHPERPIFWNNGSYDVYAYYPQVSPVTSVDDLPFSVATDQQAAGNEQTPGGYEASDFLWASAKKQTAGNEAVKLNFRHCMSKLTVRLVKGPDYDGDELPEAEVYVHNTVTEATVDLAVGIVTPAKFGKLHTVKAKAAGKDEYTAVLVPQRIANRVPLIEVVMKGVSYLVETNFRFKQGIHHTFTLIISKNPEQVKIEIGGELENWTPQPEK